MRYGNSSTSDAAPRRRSLATALLLAALVLAGCEDRPPPPPQTGPEPTDSLVRLMRHQLTAEDPVAVEKKILCEIDRLFLKLGEDSAVTRIRQASDTVYRSENRELQRRVDSALANKVLGPEECDLPTDSTAAADSTARAPEGADTAGPNTSPRR